MTIKVTSVMAATALMSLSLAADALPLTVAYTDSSGNQWAQVNEVTNQSWEQWHNALCPASAGYHCAGTAPATGRDLNGWTMASLTQVAALFSTDFLGGASGASYAQSSANLSDLRAEAIFAFFFPTLVSAWPPNNASDFRQLRGYTVECYLCDPDNGFYPFGESALVDEYVDLSLLLHGDFLSQLGVGLVPPVDRLGFVGAWLYRPSGTNGGSTPEPSTLMLLLLATAFLALAQPSQGAKRSGTRRNKGLN